MFKNILFFSLKLILVVVVVVVVEGDKRMEIDKVGEEGYVGTLKFDVKTK